MAIARGNPSEASESSSPQKPFKMPAYVVDVATRILEFYPHYKDKDWQKTPQLAVQYINTALNFVIRPIRTIVTGSTPEQDTQVLPDIPTLRKQACQLLITDISIAENKSVDEWINLAIKLGEEAYSAAIYQNGANFCNFLHAIRSLIITTLSSDPEASQKLKLKIAELKRDYEIYAKEISIEAGKGHATSRLEEKKKQAILARAYLQDDEARLTVSRDKAYMGNLPCPERGEQQPNGLPANPNYNTCLQNEYYLSFFEQYLLSSDSAAKNAKPNSKYRKISEAFEHYKSPKAKHSHKKSHDSSSDDESSSNDSPLMNRGSNSASSVSIVPTRDQYLSQISSQENASSVDHSTAMTSAGETRKNLSEKDDTINQLTSSSSSTGQIVAELRHSGSTSSNSPVSVESIPPAVPLAPPTPPRKTEVVQPSQNKPSNKKKMKAPSPVQGENDIVAESNINQKPSL